MKAHLAEMMFVNANSVLARDKVSSERWNIMRKRGQRREMRLGATAEQRPAGSELC